MTDRATASATVIKADGPQLRRSLTLWDLVFYGIVLVQPVAPMGIFGVVSQEARGHVITTILIGMFAMLLTALSYGRMARAYPSAGSAFTYVGQELHPALGYVTGWSMVMDYVLNPMICTIYCSKVAMNFLPGVPYPLWVAIFAALFTMLNLRGVKASARTNEVLAVGMFIVVILFVAAAVRYLTGVSLGRADLIRPFYDPATFSLPVVLTGASIACLTYIGFDGISTLSEEVENPRRNILLATVLTCVITGILASVLVYLAQLVWGNWTGFPDVDTAFVHVSGKAGGPWLFALVNLTLLVANLGSGTGAHLGAARLLYGMGRSDALPRRFFGAVDPRHNIPRNNVLLVGVLAFAGGLLLTYQLGAEMLNFGAFIAFMGVNLAAFVRYWVRSDERRIANFILPILGFLVCLYLWLSLRWPAKVAGGAWLAAGVIYGAIKTRGFRERAISFDIPAD
ncbi:MAG TPA: APC family permease [Vicinamibacterales bacterium]|jgi:putrescine importer|nr:APC family permease [Vicinamibacterales bacterium]